VNRVRAQIALAAFIAEQRLAVASSQNERGAQAGGPAADNENINLHQSAFRKPGTSDGHSGVSDRSCRAAATAAPWTEMTPKERRGMEAPAPGKAARG
jgi:hypothetical protein